MAPRALSQLHNSIPPQLSMLKIQKQSWCWVKVQNTFVMTVHRYLRKLRQRDLLSLGVQSQSGHCNITLLRECKKLTLSVYKNSEMPNEAMKWRNTIGKPWREIELYLEFLTLWLIDKRHRHVLPLILPPVVSVNILICQFTSYQLRSYSVSCIALHSLKSFWKSLIPYPTEASRVEEETRRINK